MSRIIGPELKRIPWQEKPAGCTEPVWRYDRNPIIGRHDIPSANSIFNSAVVPYQDGFAGVFRCDDRNVNMNIFAGFSKDGSLKGTEECLNDIMIVRGDRPHVTRLTLTINGQKIEKFYGDGLIIATATGSSAYSLAAGGPLLMPEMKDIIVTPICSHTFNGLTYVAGPDSVVRVDLDDFESAPMISPDGRHFVTLEPFDYMLY